jgi:AraC-like DNA-binding protein
MLDRVFLNLFSFHEVGYEVFHESAFVAPYYFIMFLQEGRAEIQANGATLTLEAGEALYIPRGIRYAIKLYGQPHIRFGSYAYLNHVGEHPHTARLLKIKPTDAMRKNLVALSKCDGVNYESLGHFYLFLADFYKALPAAKSEKHKKLHLAMQLLRRDPNLTTAALAARCGMSESGIYRLFREFGGITPADFRMQSRIERAVDELITTSLPIEEISARCGFSSSSYFRKCLHAAYGKTPSQIRKSGLSDSVGF